MKIKEYGSDFNLCLNNKWILNDSENSIIRDSKFSLFYSGRAAIFNILKYGIKKYNWKTVYFPSYYCHEVIEYIQKSNLNIELKYYNYSPFSQNNSLFIKDQKTSVIINVDYFGLKKNNLSGYKHCVVIDDLTHNILDYKNSRADFCFGSLRKELPIPAGGFAYSNNKVPNNTFFDVENEKVIEKRIYGMLLKNEYINGISNNKELFRSIFKDTEEYFNIQEHDSLPERAQEIIYSLNIKKIIKKKKKNIKFALKKLKKHITKHNIIINLNSKNGFGLIFKFDKNKNRDDFKKYLINKKIYPAILWPNQIFENDKKFENKMLFIHVDYRYKKLEMKNILNIIIKYFNNE